LAAGCEDGESSGAIPEQSVSEVAAKVSAGSVVPVDANSDSTREEHGTVPGAILLSSTDYEVDELPSDKSKELVFFCANTHCSASDKAAERAKEAGYANVSIMRAGIEGWKDAGQSTKPVG
jgi:rhodanese-related sulfurtransferase